MDFLKELNQQGTTIILTTHYLEEAENLCRHIGIIQQGKLIVDMSIKALLSQLETETFILDLALSSSTPKVDNYNVTIIDELTMEVEVKRGQGLNNLFIQLNGQGINVLSMRNKANRLEELFISMALNKPKITEKI